MRTQNIHFYGEITSYRELCKTWHFHHIIIKMRKILVYKTHMTMRLLLRPCLIAMAVSGCYTYDTDEIKTGNQTNNGKSCRLFGAVYSHLFWSVWKSFSPLKHISAVKVARSNKQIEKLGPVVQSHVSLTSSLVVKLLTVLVSTISNSQVFLLKKCE